MKGNLKQFAKTQKKLERKAKKIKPATFRHAGHPRQNKVEGGASSGK